MINATLVWAVRYRVVVKSEARYEDRKKKAADKRTANKVLAALARLDNTSRESELNWGPWPFDSCFSSAAKKYIDNTQIAQHDWESWVRDALAWVNARNELLCSYGFFGKDSVVDQAWCKSRSQGYEEFVKKLVSLQEDDHTSVLTEEITCIEHLTTALRIETGLIEDDSDVA